MPQDSKKGFKAHCPKSDSGMLQPWLAAARGLRDQQFENIEEAVRAVTGSVLLRMNMAEGPESEEARRFINELLSGDPEVLEVIAETMNIKAGRKDG